MSYLMESPLINTLNVAANSTSIIPAGYSILQVIVREKSGAAITGGLKIGTTNGGVDVCVALVVTANSIQAISDSQLLKSVFSATVDTTLYIQAVVAWNTANIDVYFVLRKFTLIAIY